MGQVATLEAGDPAWVAGRVSGEIRNDGQERAEAIVSLVGPPETLAVGTPIA